MTRIVVKKLVWDEYNLEHSNKHKVNLQEIEEISKNFRVHKKAKKGRYMLIGRTNARILSIVIDRKGTGVYYVVSARDSDKPERKILYEKEEK